MIRIGISFKETEYKLVEFLRTKRSQSNYIKDLIETDMNKNKSTNKSIKSDSVEEYSW